MIHCEICDTTMKLVMRFDGTASYRFRRCPVCYYETRPAPLFLDDTKQLNKMENDNKIRKKEYP